MRGFVPKSRGRGRPEATATWKVAGTGGQEQLGLVVPGPSDMREGWALVVEGNKGFRKIL